MVTFQLLKEQLTFSHYSILTNIFLGICLFLYSLIFIYIMIFWMRHLFFKESKRLEKSNITDFDVTILVPIHNESPQIIKECLISLTALKARSQLTIWLLPSPHTDELNINDLLSRIECHHHLEIKNFNAMSKSLKIQSAMPSVATPFVGIIDVDHSCDPNWVLDSLNAIEGETENCIGCQGIRKIKGSSTLVSLWDSFCNHFFNEVINKLRHLAKINIPFTGTSALFKTDIFKTVPFKEHFTEDTNWFMRLRTETNFYLTYQDRSATYELLPSTLINYFNRRFRWSTGHTQSYFECSPIKNFFNFAYTVHGAFFLVGAMIYATFVLRAIYLILQMQVFAQISLLLLFTLSILARYYLVIALLPCIVMLFSEYSNEYLGIFSGFAQQIPSTREISLVLEIIFFLQILLMTLFGIKFRLIRRQYFKTYFLVPIFIFLELYFCFLGLFNIRSRKSSWNSYKPNRIKNLNRLVVGASLILTFVFSYNHLILIWNGFKYIETQGANSQKASTFEIRGAELFKENKPYQVKGVSINAYVDSRVLEQLKMAGFNSLRFYHLPSNEIIEDSNNLGMSLIFQTGASNWDSLKLTSFLDKWLLKLNFFMTHHYGIDHSNVLFPIVGNELDIWPGVYYSEQEDIDRLTTPIQLELDKLFKNLSDKNFIFSYSSPLIDKKSLDRYKFLPILMVNTNDYDQAGMQKLLKVKEEIKKPIILSEWGGYVAIRNAKMKMRVPAFLKIFLLKKNYQKNKEFNGYYFFALKDSQSLPSLSKNSDPFLLDDEEVIGLIDQNYNLKDEYWLMAELQTEVKFEKCNSGICLKNQTNEYVQVIDLNNYPLNIMLPPSGQAIVNSDFIKQGINSVLIKKNQETLMRTPFRSGGYLSACERSVSFQVEKGPDAMNRIKFSSSIQNRAFLIRSSKESIQVRNTENYLTLKLWSKNEALVWNLGLNSSIEVIGNEPNDLMIFEMVPCQVGSPLLI